MTETAMKKTKKERKFMGTVSVAKYELYMVFFSVKFWILIILAWIFMDYFYSGVLDLARDFGETLPPAALPFYYSDGMYCNAGFLIFVFLISDAPFRENNQVYLLERCGRRGLCVGQLVSLCLISILFTAAQFVISFIMALPHISFNGWGKVWGSFADSTAQWLGYISTASVSQAVLDKYAPMQAVALSFILVSLMGMCYGMVLYFLNNISGGRAGTAAMCVWSVAWLFLQGMSGNIVVSKLLAISPQRWLDLSLIGPGDVPLRALWAVIAIIVLGIINVLVDGRVQRG